MLIPVEIGEGKGLVVGGYYGCHSGEIFDGGGGVDEVGLHL